MVSLNRIYKPLLFFLYSQEEAFYYNTQETLFHETIQPIYITKPKTFLASSEMWQKAFQSF
jgi:hypothetical protein